MVLVDSLATPFTACWNFLSQLPKKIVIPCAVALLFMLLYGWLYWGTTSMVFSFSGENCIAHTTLLPTLNHQSSVQKFSVNYAQNVRMGNVELLARQICFKPTAAPIPGDVLVKVSPYGSFVAAKTYKITVGQPPKISLTPLHEPLPLSKPLELSMSGVDKVFNYTLRANNQETSCDVVKSVLRCNLDSLDLAQGATYNFELLRRFENKPAQVFADQQVEILRATEVTEASIRQGELVYAKPRDITFSFDKPVSKVEAKLESVNNDKQSEIQVNQQLEGQVLTIKLIEDLSRLTDFVLTLDKLEAQDGSSLVEPYRLKFATSGGPRVTGISIPKAGVALGASAVIGFDQELQEGQDVPKLVTVEGGVASVSQRGNQFVVNLANIGKCVDFTIKITNEVVSNYGVGGNSGWSFASRTICHSVETIGYSVKGRPINAYIFGSGGTTILFTGAIHGNELSSSYLLDNWIKELEANAKNLPSGRQIVVIPEVNPDGVAAGTRTNARNVDLNRNYEVSDWKADITDVYNRPFAKGGGEAPMSEPETKALAAYTARLKPRLTMSFHSIGGLVVANQAGDSSALARVYAKLAGYGNATGQSSTTFEYSISGTYDDWIAEKLGLPSVLVELGSHTYSQFPQNIKALWEMVGS